METFIKKITDFLENPTNKEFNKMNAQELHVIHFYYKQKFIEDHPDKLLINSNLYWSKQDNAPALATNIIKK